MRCHGTWHAQTVPQCHLPCYNERMKHYRRWILNVLTVLSLALALGTAVLWALNRGHNESVIGPDRSTEVIHLVDVFQGDLTLSVLHGGLYGKWFRFGSPFLFDIYQMEGVRHFPHPFLGFGWDWRADGGPSSYSRLVFLVPFLSLSSLFAILPTVRFGVWLRRRFVIPPGRCRSCGYDLRATPERCPECGTLPAKPIKFSN